MLQRATLFAALGIALILLFALTLPLKILQYVGLPLFLLAILLIASGFRPYKKLSQKVFFPDLIELENGSLRYREGSHWIFEIPLTGIYKADYLEKRAGYGLLLKIDAKTILPLTDPGRFSRTIAEHLTADGLLLPYFLKSSVEELQTHL